MPPAASDDLHTHVARARPAWTTRPGWRALRARRTRRSLVLGGLVLLTVLSPRGVRLNTSGSVPLGFYRLSAVSTPLARGTLVVLPVPAEVRPWQNRWQPILKPVAAIGGDVVCLWDEGVWIEGQWYGPIYEEAAQKPLPKLRGCLLVKPGEVFLASSAPKSLDSRYFNAVPITGLTAKAIPLLTWR